MEKQEQNKQKKQGVSILVTSLACNEAQVIKKAAKGYSETPWSGNCHLSFQYNIKNRYMYIGKPCWEYATKKSSFLLPKYQEMAESKKDGECFIGGLEDFILMDICLPIALGLDEEKILKMYEPVLDTIDHVIFIDRSISKSPYIRKHRSYLGKANLHPVRDVMLRLCKKYKWYIFHTPEEALEFMHHL